MPIQDLIEKCAASRNTRRSRYLKLREWLLRGTESGSEAARYNKLKAHLSLQMSYLYAPESTKFYLALPPEDRVTWQAELDCGREVFLRRWRESGSDVQFGQFVLWALAYATTVAKLLPSEETVAGVEYVSPWDIGVLREDIPSFDKQDALTHHFALSVPEVARLVKGHPESAKILEWADQQSAPGGTEPRLPAMMQQIIVGSVTGAFPDQRTVGNTLLGQGNDERPDIQEPLVECVEVWEKASFTHDKKGKRSFTDYLVSTVIGDWTILERRNPILPHQPTEPGAETEWTAELGFVQICPDPLPDYIWGSSSMLPLIPLQQWREARMAQIDLMYKKQLDPPRFFAGVPLSDDKLRAMSQVGGFVSSPQPQAKMDVIQIPSPQDPFALIHEIDAMYADAGGIPEILQGASAAGARSGQQVSAQANIAVGRIRGQALVVEDALELLATRMFHLMQRRDPTLYRGDTGKPFLLSQLPADCTVKVSAHSSSPVYAERIEEKAAMLLKAGAIDLVTFVELMDPPGMEALRDKAKGLQEQKAKMAERMLKVQEEKAQKRGR
jgi:hypothetical protein